MRPLLLLLLLGLTVGGCHCGADQATPVTLRIKNTTPAPIYVNATSGVMGMTVQRKSLNDWNGFVEEPPCACLSCDTVCSCQCNAPTPPAQVQQIPGGTNLERTWNGVVQVSGLASCGGAIIGGTNCLRKDIPAVDETFRVHFCYAPSAPGLPASDGGTPVLGTLREDSLLCVNREFRVEDGVVEVSPAQGSDCTTNEECQGDGGTAFCVNGSCTSACPPNDFPSGTTWQVSVPEPDDMGFFSFTTEGANKVYSGTGTVGSVRYDNNTTTLRLQRPAQPSGFYGGAAYVTLPAGYAVPFNVGETVSVRIVDASSVSYGNRGIVIRDGQGKLLLAADTALISKALSATDTAPFTVSALSKVVGCEFNDCGKRLFTATRFVGGATPADLNPGKSATAVAGGLTYKVLNVTDASYLTTSCKVPRALPYVILVDRSAP